MSIKPASPEATNHPPPVPSRGNTITTPSSLSLLHPGGGGHVNESDGMAGLYVALHDFSLSQQHVLSFKKGQVVEVTKSSSSNSWHRGKINGKAGFVPSNGYLRKIEIEKCARMVVRQDFEGGVTGQLRVYEGQVVTLLTKMDLQWWTVRSDSGRWGQVPAKLLKVVNEGADVMVHTPRESPDIVISKLARTQSANPMVVPRQEPPGLPRSSTISRSTYKTTEDRGDVRIASGLVECVRKRGVSYQVSKEIVRDLLGKLSEEIGEWSGRVGELSGALDNEGNLQCNSVDSLKLEQLLQLFTAHTEDEQQRGWICRDDTEEIHTILSDIHSLLRNSNPRVVVRVLEEHKYEPLLTLVQYYMLEKRTALKRLTLEVILETIAVKPDPSCSIYLSSHLPIQLATDLQATNVLTLLERQVEVFVAVLVYPNTMPRNHHDLLDEEFIEFLLATMERFEPWDPEGSIPHLFLNVILALNLHYSDILENTVCAKLQSRGSATAFSENLLVAFNRGTDPAAQSYATPVNSVKKLTRDVFLSRGPAEIFYTNDIKVLLEVLHRNAIDRDPGDQERAYYLEVLKLIVTNTDYIDHTHYKSELAELASQVSHEDSEDVKSIAAAQALTRALAEM